MEEAKALGMRGFEILAIGALVDPKKIVPAGPAFLGEESLKSIIERMTVDPATGELTVGAMRYSLMVLPEHPTSPSMC